MGLLFNLNNILPQKFLLAFPLYIGVELILGASIFNLAGGGYGIVSIFTGHPINFWQWLYDVLALMSIPFYISALMNLTDPKTNTRKMALLCLLYTADSIRGVLYTIYFMYFWFSHEDKRISTTSVPKRASSAEPASQGQSASDARELFLIWSATLGITAIRVYANLVIIGFTKALLKQKDRYAMSQEGENEVDAEIYPESRFAIVRELKALVRDLEERSLEIIRDYLV